MGDAPELRPYGVTILSSEPFERVGAFCTECGRQYDVLVHGGDVGNARVICACGVPLLLDLFDF